MKISKKLAAPIIATSLLLSGGTLVPLTTAHAAVQVSQYQKDIDAFATHYASILHKLNKYQADIENAQDEDEFEGLYDAYMTYFDEALENTDPSEKWNVYVQEMDTYIYDSLVELYNFEIDTMDYQAGYLTETQWNKAKADANKFVDEQNTLFQQAAQNYKAKYKISYSTDMLYLLDIEESVTTYTVKKGDTLYGIATKYKTSVSELVKINSLSGYTLKIGQVLKVPVLTTTTPSPTPSTPTAPSNPSTDKYVVKKGDTLTAVAKKYNTTVPTLKKWNNLKSDALKIGQVLQVKVPALKYTVQKGDTLFKISKKYSISVVNLKKINNLSSDSISIGQILKVNL